MSAVAAPTVTQAPVAAPRAGRLDTGQLLLITGLIAVGIGLRTWIAFTNYGVRYDTGTAYIVAHLFAVHPLEAYSSLRYPYPSGFLPLLVLCHSIARWTGASFWAVWKMPAVLADAGIAAVLAWGLGRLGATPRARVETVALVMLGPIFVIVSGYHGQLDPVAILPALAAVIVWQLGGSERGWQAGLLIGLGTAIKTVPLFMVLALLPSVRSRREAVVLIVSALAVPLLAVAPFWIAHQHDTWKSLTFNHGVAGLGGLSMLVQPGLTSGWLHHHLPPISGATRFFVDEQNLFVGLAVLGAGLFAWRRRLDAITAAALIWLAVYLANTNWAYQYFIWGLPFFLLAGWRGQVAALQLVLLLPASQMYFAFAIGPLGWLYIPLLMLVWCSFAVRAAVVTSGYRRSRSRSHDPLGGVRPNRSTIVRSSSSNG